jgi:hypothetical protein
MNNSIVFVSGCALAVLVSGCIVDTDDDDEDPGTLTALWTVDNTTDPGACSYYARDPGLGMDFELLVYDDLGGLVVKTQADCRDFDLSIDLYGGLYQGQATMVDPATEEALSTTLPLPNIRVHEDVETTIDIDFPPSAFFYPVSVP